MMKHTDSGGALSLAHQVDWMLFIPFRIYWKFSLYPILHNFSVTVLPGMFRAITDIAAFQLIKQLARPIVIG
jgi:hypothetical protein